MNKIGMLVGVLLVFGSGISVEKEDQTLSILRFLREPVSYEYPYCLPFFFREQPLSEMRATPASFTPSTQLGPLNGVAQDIVFSTSVTHTNTVCGYASQYNPGSNSGSTTAAGLQLSYDMFAAGRFDYVTVSFDPTFNPQARGINGIGIGQGVQGQVLTDLGSTARALRLAVQTEPVIANQKIYLIGYTYIINSEIIYAGQSTNQWQVALVRYNWDGSIDTSFNPTRKSPGGTLPGPGVVLYSLPRGSIQGLAIALQPDKKILITGQAAGQLFVLRYNYDGTLDTTFNAGATASTGGTPGVFMCSVVGYPTVPNTGQSVIGADIGYAIDLQSDGKIVVAGTGITQQGYRALILVRLTTNGQLDTTFGPQTSITPYPNQTIVQKGKVVTQIQGYDDEGLNMVIQPDDKIIVVGTSLDSSNGKYYLSVVRYLANGIVDTSFGPQGLYATPTFSSDGIATTKPISLNGKVLTPINGSTFAAATGVTLQTDGKIVISGFNNYATSVVNTQQTFCFARYTTTGFLDVQTFNTAGTNATTDLATGLTAYPQKGVRTVSIQGYNDKSFAVAMQPITSPKFTQEQPFAVGSSLNFGTTQAYLEQIYAFAASRLTATGLVDGTLTVTFTNA